MPGVTVERVDDDLMREVETGLRRGDFHTTYHVVLDGGTGLVESLEARPTWSHPARGRVDVADLARRLAGTGALSVIERQTLRDACHQAVGWRLRGRYLRVRVSLFTATLGIPDRGRLVVGVDGPDPASWVKDALRESGLPAERVVVSTESDVVRARLAAAGIPVARPWVPGADDPRPGEERTLRCVRLVDLTATALGRARLAEAVEVMTSGGGHLRVTGVDTPWQRVLAPRLVGLLLQGDAFGAARPLTQPSQLVAYADSALAALRSTGPVIRGLRDEPA